MAPIELRLLAAMLYKGDFDPIVKGHIGPTHFLTDTGKILYQFITTYHNSSNGAAKFPSLAVVRNRFDNIDIPDPDPGDNISALAHEVRVSKARDDLRKHALEAQTVADSSDDPFHHLSRLSADIRGMDPMAVRNGHVSIAKSLESVLENYERGDILPLGIPWPWPSLTAASKGMHRGEFYVICGRPKSRKTFVAIYVGIHAFMREHQRVLFFTPEMPPQQVLLRAIATASASRYQEFKNSALDEAEHFRLLELARTYAQVDEDDGSYQLRLRSAIKGLPEGQLPSFDVVQSTGQSVSWMASQVELYRPTIVIVDSFYRHAHEGRKNDTDYKVVGAIARELKNLAMSENLVVIGTHQLNRDASKQVGDLGNMSYADAVGQELDLGLRVITQSVNGVGKSALINLGGREVPFDGLFINNIPCVDFSEQGIITNRAVVEKWLEKDSDEEAKEEIKKMKKKTVESVLEEESKKNGKSGNALFEPVA